MNNLKVDVILNVEIEDFLHMLRTTGGEYGELMLKATAVSLEIMSISDKRRTSQFHCSKRQIMNEKMFALELARINALIKRWSDNKKQSRFLFGWNEGQMTLACQRA